MAKVVKSNRSVIDRAVGSLLKSRMVVGVPSGSAPETSPDGKRTVPMATVAYIQEFGDDELHIPSRPFMRTGFASVRGQVTAQMVAGARAAFTGDLGAADRTFHSVGLIAQAAIKQAILDGGFAPLSERTLQARARRRAEGGGGLSRSASSKGARAELKRREQGVAASADFARPLFDKGDLYKAIVYAVRVR